MEELVTKRTTHTKHFRLDNGLYQSVIHTVPIHYKNNSGNLTDVITSYVSLGTNIWGCETNELIVTINIPTRTITYERRGFPSLTITYLNTSNPTNISCNLAAGTASVTRFWSNTTLNLRLTNSGVKETFTLTKAGHPASFSFGYNTVLTPEVIRGNIHFKNGNESIYVIKPVYNKASTALIPTILPWVLNTTSKTMSFTVPAGITYPYVIDPSISPFGSESNYGRTAKDAISKAWALARAETTADNYYTDDELGAFTYNWVPLTPWYYIYRAMTGFDTSSIPDDATIDSVTMSLYFNSKTGVGDVVHAVPTSLTVIDNVTDHNIANFTCTSAGYWSDSPSAGYNTADIDKTVVPINKTGITCYGFLTEHDLSDSSPPPDDNNGVNYTRFYGVGAAGTSQDPYLTVNYSVPSNIMQMVIST